MNYLQIMQLIGNCITILGLILFIVLWSRKIHKDLKKKRELKKIEKSNKAKEHQIKEDLYAAYLKNQTKENK